MGYKVAPYINFVDNAAEALEFYQGALGGELTVSRMGDMPYPGMPEADAQKVMHGQLDLDDGFAIMAADTPTGMKRTVGDNISVTLFGNDPEELHRRFDALSDGGTVVEPFAQAPWGDYFGMLTDRFGVHWMVNGSAA
jgi:PhnB protein